MLPRIVDAVGDKLEIFYDSGIRCGADIAKSLALAAKMCLIGQPCTCGLVLEGESGVSHCDLLDVTLHLAGFE